MSLSRLHLAEVRKKDYKCSWDKISSQPFQLCLSGLSSEDGSPSRTL